MQFFIYQKKGLMKGGCVTTMQGVNQLLFDFKLFFFVKKQQQHIYQLFNQSYSQEDKVPYSKFFFK